MKVLFVSNTDWFLYNYRLSLAQALKERGCEVAMVCPTGEYASRLRESGFRVMDWNLRRRSTNPIYEAMAVARLIHIYRRERPDVVHHFTIKANIYGVLAARITKVRRVINMWNGLGLVFSDAFHPRSLRGLLVLLMRLIFANRVSWTMFQNEDDLRVLERMRIVQPERASVIPGSGVRTERFAPRADGCGPEIPVVLFGSRLLWDKGIGDFVRAARLLRERGVQADFWVAGSPDEGNPGSVSEDDLEDWKREGIVRFLGQRQDMPEVLRQADIAVLPTYYKEGVPLFLLEAAATGLPIIASDIEGCRIVVQQGISGFIIPPKDPRSLAIAIKKLVEDSSLRKQMGRASRKIAVSRFDERIIVQRYLDVYQKLISLP